MKPLHIGLLVVAGALGGAVVMKVAQRPQSTPPAPVMAQAPAPPVEAPAPVAPAPATPPVAEDRPSPLSPPREMPKPGRTLTRRPVERPVLTAPPLTRVVVPATPSVATGPEPATPASPAAMTLPSVNQAARQPEPPARPEPEHVTPPPAAPAPPEPHKVTLNAGILIPVRLVDGLTSERNMAGDLFAATLDKPLAVSGFVIAERGARVEGRVVASDPGGRVKGVSSLAVQITRLHLSDGQTIALSTDSFERRAEESRRDDAVKVGAGAALGALIGAIAGGGKGAAIGAGAGGAAGAGTVMATRGRTAALPSETRISFRLSAPVVVTERLW